MKRDDLMQIIKRDGHVADFDQIKFIKQLLKQQGRSMLLMTRGDKT